VALNQLAVGEVRDAVTEIERALISQEMDDAIWANAFSTWGAIDKETFSRFLKKIGDAYARDGQPELAAVRYHAAWGLNKSNTEAAIYDAGLLGNFHLKIDPQSKKLNQFVGDLFDENTGIYTNFRGTLVEKKRLLPLHTVLGSILEEMPLSEPGKAGTAEFQWGRAAALQQEIHNEDPRTFAHPGIYSHRAAALSKKGDAYGTWKWSLEAADGFVADFDKAPAMEMIKNAIEAKYSATDADKRQFDIVSRKVEELANIKPRELIPIDWLPVEFHRLPMSDEDRARCQAIVFRYDQKILEQPDMAIAFNIQKRKELEAKLTPEQRAMLDHFRAILRPTTWPTIPPK
jgi:hypothetical protein